MRGAGATLARNEAQGSGNPLAADRLGWLVAGAGCEAGRDGGCVLAAGDWWAGPEAGPEADADPDDGLNAGRGGAVRDCTGGGGASAGRVVCIAAIMAARSGA